MAKLVAVLIVAVCFAVAFAGSRWLILRIMGQPPKGQVYGSWTCFLGAFVGAVGVVGTIVLWIWFTAESAKDQVLAFSCLLLLFGGLGAWCLWSGWGTRARYNDIGVDYRDQYGGWHRHTWSDLVVAQSRWGALTLGPSRGARFRLDPEAPGAADLLIAAFEAGATGADKFVRRRPADRP